MAKAKSTGGAVELTGYNMKLKKSEPLKDAKISKTSNGRFFAKGLGSDGTVVCTALGKEKAEAAIAAGIAKKEGNWK